MRTQIIGYLVLIGTLFGFNGIVSAEWEKSETIPAYKDFVVASAPDGFVHAYEKGVLNNFIIEYLPRGETLEEWSKMLSVKGMPSKKNTECQCLCSSIV